MATIPRLPIWLYITVGILVLAVGWAVKFAIDLQEDGKAEALLRAAPEAVLIEEFNADRDIGAGDEITIRAQAALDLSSKISTIDGELQKYGTFFGLFPVTALDTKRSISAILLSETFILENAFIEQHTVGQGPFGPIIEINGAIGSISNVRVPVQRSLEGMGRTLPNDVLTIVPFIDGRDVALRPDPNKGRNVFLIFALIGGIYIGYGALRWMMRRKAERL